MPPHGIIGTIGPNPSTNRFKQARLSVDAQHTVDEYKARSVWSAWWSLDENRRRRYFTREERAFITRYGARLDEIACHRAFPKNETSASGCLCSSSVASSGSWSALHGADLAEHDSAALRAENRALKAQVDHYERRMLMLQRDLEAVDDDAVASCATWLG
jgi:hypothetical protein